MNDAWASAIEAMEDAVLFADDDRRYVDVNTAACKLFGVERSELLGRRIDDFAPAPADFDVEASWRSFLQTGTQTGEFPLTRRDGTRRLVDYRAKANVVPGRHLSVLRDVTDERERENQFARLADNLPYSVSRIDADHRYTFVNSAFERYAGGVKSDFIGKTNDELGVEVELADAWRQAVAGALAGSHTAFEFAFGTPFGPRAFAAHLTPEISPSGAIVSVLAITRDVTDERKARQALEASLHFAEQFVGILGHDLRNPLQSIVMAASILRQKASSGPDGKIVDRIVSSTTRMTRMVEQLLDLTRTRLGGGIQVEKRDLDIAAVVSDAVDEIALAHPARVVTCKVPRTLRGEFDGDRLGQVVSNLVGNAVVHGDPTREVSVLLERGEGSIALTVHNYGPPIPAALLDKLFDPFRRGVNEGTTKSSGLGLGLYIAREVVNAHGGHLQVSSTEDAGTTFAVVLPM